LTESPFFIIKELQGIAGAVRTVRKLRNGTLLVETSSDKQSQQILKAASFGNLYKITVQPHSSLNTSRGVISCSDLVYATDAEIKEELASQGVTDIYRIKTRVDGTLKPTSTIVLTFKTPQPPQKTVAGFHILNVRIYIPNPMRCFCSHTTNNCKSQPICRACGLEVHDGTECKALTKCVN
jgi:hypothetical protein